MGPSAGIATSTIDSCFGPGKCGHVASESGEGNERTHTPSTSGLRSRSRLCPKFKAHTEHFGFGANLRHNIKLDPLFPQLPPSQKKNKETASPCFRSAIARPPLSSSCPHLIIASQNFALLPTLVKCAGPLLALRNAAVATPAISVAPFSSASFCICFRVPQQLSAPEFLGRCWPGCWWCSAVGAG
eukprot:3586326-Rhodomonas_salina.1